MHKPKRNLAEELKIPRREVPPATAMCQLKMRLNCCKGRGYIISTDGPTTRANVCNCVQSCPNCRGQARFVKQQFSQPCLDPSPKVVVNLINGAGIPSRYGYASLMAFNNFSGNGQELVAKLRQWVDQYQKNGKGLVLEGPVGVGKTYLLAAMALQLATAGYSIKFVDFFQLLSELKAGYSNNQADDTVIKPLIDVDVLVIDELGKGRNSDWELSILDQLVMGRYNQNKTILASTNYSLSTVAKPVMVNQNLEYSEKSFRENMFDQGLDERVGRRIFSRLTESCYFFKLTGEDYRRKFVQASRGLVQPGVHP